MAKLKDRVPEELIPPIRALLQERLQQQQEQLERADKWDRFLEVRGHLNCLRQLLQEFN